jgi:tetratricopeptide (TPR) repeat protein
LLQSLLDRSSKEFGANHAETLKYAVNLAWCERHLQKLSSAEANFRRAVEGFESTLGRLHPYTLASYDGLAQLLAADKRWQEAAANDKVVIERRDEAGEAEDADTARILGRMVRKKEGGKLGTQNRSEIGCTLINWKHFVF